jgi:sporadic carbohydrate cluster protein (TIGR04323 family)
MTIASITTDMNFGPYKIPSNAQNMIMNNYAQRNDLKIGLVIPEPIMSDQLGTTQWLYKDFKLSNIILCSIHQLPQKEIHQNDLIKNLREVKFNFAIEGLNGSGENFLLECMKEAKFFMAAKKIDTKKTDWIKLYQQLISS